MKNNMVTREWLLEKGFSFRVWEGSESPDGEYTLRGYGYYIVVGYSDMFKWDYTITNYDKNIEIKATRQESITIEHINKCLNICEIKL
jgi:hypothetical protein